MRTRGQAVMERLRAATEARCQSMLGLNTGRSIVPLVPLTGSLPSLLNPPNSLNQHGIPCHSHSPLPPAPRTPCSSPPPAPPRPPATRRAARGAGPRSRSAAPPARGGAARGRPWGGAGARGKGAARGAQGSWIKSGAQGWSARRAGAARGWPCGVGGQFTFLRWVAPRPTALQRTLLLHAVIAKETCCVLVERSPKCRPSPCPRPSLSSAYLPRPRPT